MNLKKSALSIAIGTVIGLGTVNTSQALTINMDYEGLFTLLDPTGNSIANVSKPYYYDATWNYGNRTQISGTMSFDANTGAGTGTVTPFEFFSGGPVITSDLNFQAIGDGLILGNMNFSWRGSNTTTNIVLDATGLFSSFANGLPPIGTIIDQSFCAASGACATPASNNVNKLRVQIGPVPIATSSFNVAGSSGFGTTINQLSLGTDDGIGGSPMDNGQFSQANANFDFTSLTIVSNPHYYVPIPASVWLFGSGLLALSGISRRRKQS